MPSDKTNSLSPTSVLSQEVLAHALKVGAIPAEGRLTPEDLPRLTAALTGYREPPHWRLFAEPSNEGKGDGRLWWLEVDAELDCACSRCLGPMPVSLRLRRGFEFCRTAKEADQKTEDWLADQADGVDHPDVDFLAPEDQMTVLLLVEDELLLALPMTPKHGDCQAPGAVALGQGAAAETSEDKLGTERPFAGLRDLLKKPS